MELKLTEIALNRSENQIGKKTKESSGMEIFTENSLVF